MRRAVDLALVLVALLALAVIATATAELARNVAAVGWPA